MKVLERRTLARLGEERRIDARERIYGFPQELAALKSSMAELVAALFQENVYADSPIMRGVYFTSGTQEGRPIDRVMNSMAKAFGVLAGGALRRFVSERAMDLAAALLFVAVGAFLLARYFLAGPESGS